jgi:hypothetical protein
MACAMLRPSRVCLLVPYLSDRVSQRASVPEQRARLLCSSASDRLAAVIVFPVFPGME